MGLSGGAIGGIVGGILGSILLVTVAVIFYLLAHRSREVPVAPENLIRDGTATEKPNERGSLGTQASIAYMDIEVGGRLRLPNDLVGEGGRLGTTV